MASGPAQAVIRHIHRWVSRQAPCKLLDEELLERFVDRGEESAFAALVERHGPMVFRVCRRVLRDWHAAEDAFQATFLALVRKARFIGRRELLAHWLYGVAFRIAQRARVDAAKRRNRDAHSQPKTPADPVAEVTGRELCAVLEEELNCLPERYQAPFRLCYLEGMTRDQVAQQLGWSVRTLKRRLERGRRLLCARLTRRGVTLSASLLAAGLAQQTATSAVPPLLVVRTVQVAILLARSNAGTSAAISAAVATLADGVLRGMAVAKMKLAIILVLAVGVASASAGLLFHQVLTSKQPDSAQGRSSTSTVTGHDQPKPDRLEPTRFDRHGDRLPEGAVGRLGTMRFRHANAAMLAFTADGKALLTCGAERTIRFWDAVTGRLLREQPFPPDGWLLAISPDGLLLAFQHGEGAGLSLWDIGRNQRLHKLSLAEGPQQYLQAFFSRDGKTLVTAQLDGTLRAWDVATGQGRLLGKHESQAWSLSFTADGTLLSLCSDPEAGNRVLRLWDVARGRERSRLAIAEKTQGAVISPDGRTVASWSGHGEDDKGLQFLDAATGRSAKGLVAPTLTRVFSVQFAPDSKTVGISAEDGALIWDPAAGKRVHTLAGSRGENLTFSSDGKTLAALRNWGSPYTPRTTAVLVWDLTTGAACAGAEQGHLDEVSGLALSPDGRTVASSSSAGAGGRVCLWDAATGRLLRSRSVDGMLFRRLVFSPDSKHLFVGTQYDIIRWEVATGQETGRYRLLEEGKEGRGSLWFLHLTDDGRTLLGAAVLARASSPAAGGAGGPAGIGGDGPPSATLGLQAWDVATGKRLSAITFSVVGPGTDWAGYGRFSADGRLLAIPGGILWDKATGREFGRLAIEGQGFGIAMAFSPDGSLIAAAEDHWKQGGKKKTVHVWEVATLLPVAQLETGEVAHLAFTRDGRRLISAGLEALRLWDLASEQEVASRPAHGRFRGSFGPSFVSSFALGADGRTVATGHLDTTILLWDLAAPARPATRLGADEQAACWADLAGTDGRRALTAVSRLADVPRQAVKLLRERLRPAEAPRAEELRRALAELDDARFGRRQAAAQRLARWGELAEAALKEALRGRPSPEARRRIEDLLAAPRLVREPEARRAVRAVRVLEGIGTSEARQVLESLAKGAPDARLTQEAKAAVGRLSRQFAASH